VIRARLRSEDGLSLVEVMVGIFILSVGILGAMETFIPVQSFTNASEARTVEANVAERELERIVSLGYTSVGLSSTPSHSSDPNNPNFYVNGTSFQWDLTNSSRTETLCVSPATNCPATLPPGPTSWSSGGKSGSLYRYVTWVDDPCDPTASPSKCPTAVDYKRVTVMVTHAGHDTVRKPFLISTIVADPNAGPGAG
jgi:Tfp pilus assembly protein PilV